MLNALHGLNGLSLRSEATMSFKVLRNNLRWETLAQRHANHFESIRLCNPIIYPYRAAEELLVSLENSYLEVESKDPLVRAITLEYQTRQHPLPLGLLTLGLFPILQCLRREIVENNLDPDEIDQTVLLAFLEAVNSAPVRDKAFNRIYAFLRYRTRDLVFSRLHLNQQYDMIVIPLGDESSRRWPAVGQPASELTERLCREILSPRELETLTTAVLRRETLRDLVNHTYAHFSRKERLKIYDRIRKREARAKRKFIEFFHPPMSHAVSKNRLRHTAANLADAARTEAPESAPAGGTKPGRERS